MRPTQQPSGREISLGDEDFIVTKTDLKSRITYANPIFMSITGYRESELLGQPQNIVRHPEMPCGLFRLLWNSITRGEECFAYINNLAKSGDNYWVFANITPDRAADGQITGYFSCRRKPDPEALRRIQPIYARMLATEASHSGASDACAASLALLNEHIHKEHDSYEAYVLGL